LTLPALFRRAGFGSNWEQNPRVGGELFCELSSDRVRIAVNAVPSLQGFIHV